MKTIIKIIAIFTGIALVIWILNIIADAIFGVSNNMQSRSGSDSQSDNGLF